MTWGWQDLATLAVVAAAWVISPGSSSPASRRKPAGGLRPLPRRRPADAGSCCDKPVVITLGTNPVGGKKR